MPIRVQGAASIRLDNIYRHTRDRWGKVQADHYITGMFETFDRMEAHGVASKPIPAEFGVEGFFFRDEYHFIYWCRQSDGNIGIVTVLHERMH
ncbi:type II toxin-antitoxin system RelE/ParE family toxin [Paracoccus sp. SCSIO 75233]|uniref:type II toxin-antitoxin system RelE/ParE family toxin n=1 Tax=Paracoccus sp. SCSIO 75233 TaxID=3017782 RepID=UPI0022F01405|nr:type II toxin-antitoxin system RelE/ParE family toxin [Paracoccus sp. SCSIO 75233]WBU53960.1 type II toxin-antitoxin system RelE/ParE family toxin [Paracoccus sp. SCSIO 75233]